MRPHEFPTESGLLALVDRAPRAALIVFLVISAVSFFVAIRWGSDLTFYLDEWDFLVLRDAGSFDSLMRPHNEHWTLLPILAFRAMWSVFGIWSYLPYLLMSITMHLVAAGLLRAVMRRADVAPWIATAAAGLFALFGAGAHNIMYAFQITFVGSLAFGLAQLLLTDHDDPISWRDYLALFAGLAALMCSIIGVVMVFTVGLAVLLKRGWRPAFLQTVPLAIVYLAWMFAYGDFTPENYSSDSRQILTFVVSGVVLTFDALGQVPGVGVLLAAVIPVGLVILWQSSHWRGIRCDFGAPVALAIGALLLLFITGYGRIFMGVDTVRSSRYIDLVAGMWLPLIAVSATAISRRWHVCGAVILSLFVIGTAGNAKLLSQYSDTPETHIFLHKLQAIAHSDLLKRIPDDVQPLRDAPYPITTRWLAEGARSGRIPEPERVSRVTRAVLKFQLSFRQGMQEEAGELCEMLSAPIDLDLDPGDYLVFTEGKLTISVQGSDPMRLRQIEFEHHLGNRIDVLLPASVRLSSMPASMPIMLCR